jgi:glycosyltransferase involved in cell wall biosynthesis
VIYGIWPADASHLAELDAAVDLRIYHSAWSFGLYRPAPPQIRRRSFAPVVKSGSHLKFWYRGLRRALNADRPDVLHVMCEPWGLLSVQAARWARANNAKLVMHGCDTIWHHGYPLEQRVRRILIRETLQVPGGFVAENKSALELARTNGQRPENVNARIHTNPRDERIWRLPTTQERSEARAELGLSSDTTAVGFLGRLVPQKGVLPFLDAAEHLLERGHDVRFFVAGAGPLTDAVAHRQSAGIVPLGCLAHPDGVRRYFHAMDVFACPSLRTPDWEDQGPRSLLEAMMCGCIPVGTDTGGIPEMMSGLGVLARTADPAAVADAIVAAATLAADPAERTRTAAATRDTYSGTAVAGQLVDVWRRVVAPDKPAPPAGSAVPGKPMSTTTEIDQSRIEFLAELTSCHSQLVVWKHLERSLSGNGDVDTVAPEHDLPSITRDANMLAKRVLGATQSIVCDHVPNVRLQFFVCPDDLTQLFEFDVWTRPSRGSASWANPTDVAALSTVGEYGIRKLRPGAEALMLLVYAGLSWRGTDRLAGADRQSVLTNLAADPDGAYAACRVLPPWPARQPLCRLVGSVRGGSWSVRHARQAMAGFALSGLARPRYMARQGQLRVQYLRRQECLMFELMRRHGRRVPPSGVESLLFAARHSDHLVTDL